LARGVLTRPAKAEATARSSIDQYTPKLYGAAHDVAILAAVQNAAQQLGRPMAQIALAWLLSKPYVTAPIIGATKPQHLDDALAALELKLDPSLTASLEAPYQPRSAAGID
jgi:aryl-alcohol dehydrogenase-like predicted oxidoreductase